MKYEDDIGNPVEHTFAVFNGGPWRVSKVTVTVSWPYEVENNRPHGKLLLYLMEKPRVEGIGECIVEPGQINPLGIQFRTPPPVYEQSDQPSENLPSAQSRKRREVVVTPEEIRAPDGSGETIKVVTLDCARQTAKCLQFKCVIRELRANQTALVKVRARLWNSTLVEDYPNVKYVRIISRGQLELEDFPVIQQDPSNDAAMIETIAYPSLTEYEKDQPIPLWVYLVALLVGLAILALIILILWKLGFFKRKTPDEMMKANLEKNKDMNNGPH
jgi:hypothetical protein